MKLKLVDRAALRRTLLLPLLLSAGLSVGLGAVQPPKDDDAKLAQRALHLAEQLRCVVCQNQTLADSHAELAQDLKRELQAQLASGASDQAVLDFMAQRYGDFVLYRPPLKAQTWGLWFGPVLLLIFGAWCLRAVLRQAKGATAETELEQQP